MISISMVASDLRLGAAGDNSSHGGGAGFFLPPVSII